MLKRNLLSFVAFIGALTALAGEVKVEVAVSPYADYALSVGGAPLHNHAKVAQNAVVTATATPFEGYEYTAAAEGWTLAEGRLTREFTAAADPLMIAIPSPTATSAAVDPVKYPFAKQDLKMLTIGNSWTIGPCSGAMNFTIGASALGYRIKHLGLFKENASFSMHWGNIDVVDYYTSVYTMNTTAEPYSFTKDGQKTGLSLRGLINAEDWDIVTIFDACENSNAPWNSYVWSCFSNLVETVHTLKPNAKIFLMQTWACGRYFVSYKDADGLPSFDLRDNNFDALVANYNNALHYFDTKYPGLVSRILPSGYALQLYNYEKPLKTWTEGLQITTASDYGKHLATGGSTIETLTWLKTIYGKVVPRESMPTDYANSFAGSGTDPDLGYYCVLKACAADESGYANYGRGEVALKVVDDKVIVAFTNVNSSSLAFTVPEGVTSIDYLLVAGGGGGGTSSSKSGAGGGGAGGVVLVEGFAVTAGDSMSVTVGAGGAGGYSSDTTRTGQGYEGGNSLLGDAVAHGGGAGGGLNDKWAGVRYYGTKGGSGGGAAYYKGYTGGACYEGEGHKGGDVGSAYHYRGGGGGGAGGAGANGDAGLAGGAGRSIDITGESVVYAEGGHGSYRDNWAARTTIGSGGCGCYSVNGRNGNNGIVIIRYKGSSPAPTKPTVILISSTFGW